MITDVDIGLAFTKIFLSMYFIPDEGKNTEYPRPDLQKNIADPTGSSSQYEWNGKSGKKNEHEYREYQEHPEGIEDKEYEPDDFQRERTSIRNFRKFDQHAKAFWPTKWAKRTWKRQIYPRNET